MTMEFWTLPRQVRLGITPIRSQQGSWCSSAMGMERFSHPYIPLAVPIRPVSIAVGFFNRDAIADLAVG